MSNRAKADWIDEDGNDVVKPTDEQSKAALSFLRHHEYDEEDAPSFAAFLAKRDAKHLADIALLRSALYISGTETGLDFVAQSAALKATDHYEVQREQHQAQR